MAIDLDRDSFDTEVINSKGAVMVDFWGPQCRPCLALMPVVEQLEKEYAGRVKVTKVNATQNRMLCARLKVLSLPTYLFYKDGVEVKRLGGEKVTRADLSEALKALVG